MTPEGDAYYDSLLDSAPEAYIEELLKTFGKEKVISIMSKLAKQTDVQIEKLKGKLEKETSTDMLIALNKEMDRLQKRRELLTGLIVKVTKPGSAQNEFSQGSAESP